MNPVVESKPLEEILKQGFFVRSLIKYSTVLTIYTVFFTPSISGTGQIQNPPKLHENIHDSWIMILSGSAGFL